MTPTGKESSLSLGEVGARELVELSLVELEEVDIDVPAEMLPVVPEVLVVVEVGVIWG